MPNLYNSGGVPPLPPHLQDAQRKCMDCGNVFVGSCINPCPVCALLVAAGGATVGVFEKQDVDPVAKEKPLMSIQDLRDIVEKMGSDMAFFDECADAVKNRK